MRVGVDFVCRSMVWCFRFVRVGSWYVFSSVRVFGMVLSIFVYKNLLVYFSRFGRWG